MTSQPTADQLLDVHTRNGSGPIESGKTGLFSGDPLSDDSLDLADYEAAERALPGRRATIEF